MSTTTKKRNAASSATSTTQNETPQNVLGRSGAFCDFFFFSPFCPKPSRTANTRARWRVAFAGPNASQRGGGARPQRQGGEKKEDKKKATDDDESLAPLDHSSVATRPQNNKTGPTYWKDFCRFAFNVHRVYSGGCHMADPLFASVDDVNDLLSSFDLDSLLANAPKEEKAAAARCVRPMYLATMRPKRAKEVDVNDANFAVISDDILLFNDDPSVRFENGTDVIAMDEDTGARKRATVLRDLGMGVYEVQFHHTKLKQTCYATLMSKAPARVAEAEVEVLDTAVTLVEDERGMTVTTTMTLRNSKTKKEYNQSTTETRAKPKQAAPEVPEIVPAVAPAPKADAKSGVEFEHCLNELL